MPRRPAPQTLIETVDDRAAQHAVEIGAGSESGPGLLGPGGDSFMRASAYPMSRPPAVVCPAGEYETILRTRDRARPLVRKGSPPWARRTQELRPLSRATAEKKCLLPRLDLEP